MFLFYLDASGTPDPQDKNTKHYVLLGLCLHEGTWFDIDRQIQALAKKYAYPNTQFELHVKQFAVTIKEQDDVPDFENLSRTDRRRQVRALRQCKIDAEPTRKQQKARAAKYAPTDPFIHLTRRERSHLLEEAVEVIAGHEPLKLFAEAVCKAHPDVNGGTCDPIRQSFAQVVARFDKHLQDRDAWKLRSDPHRVIDHGLLILDQDSATEALVHQMILDFRKNGHVFGPMNLVIDAPFFAPSFRVAGLQIADVCAYVVRRYLDTGAKPGSHEERHFQKLFPRFARDTAGKLYGLRHYIPSGTCHCMICHERGHGPPVAPPC